jgi:hypothetical protein
MLQVGCDSQSANEAGTVLTVAGKAASYDEYISFVSVASGLVRLNRCMSCRLGICEDYRIANTRQIPFRRNVILI